MNHRWSPSWRAMLIGAGLSFGPVADAGELAPRLVTSLLDRARTIEQRVDADHDRYVAARDAVDADGFLLGIAQARVHAFRTAWDEAVAGGHPVAAGQLAPLHHAALVDELVGERRLAAARAELNTSTEVLAADRSRLRGIEHELQGALHGTLETATAPPR